MAELPVFVWILFAAALIGLGVHGLRGLRAIRDAFEQVEPERLSSPPGLPATRALVGVLAALPVMLAMRHLGALALLCGVLVAVLGFWIAPQVLRTVRRRFEQQILDELALHLDLLAVAMESGSSWSAALVLCVERAPEGPLRRAWQQVILDIHGGMEPLDALRALEQRLRLQPMTTLLSALRAAEKLKVPAAMVLRERARHCAAARFARAERRARAVPLKLWATMLLCLVPCTAAILAYPLAGLLTRVLSGASA